MSGDKKEFTFARISQDFSIDTESLVPFILSKLKIDMDKVAGVEIYDEEIRDELDSIGIKIIYND